MKIKTIFPAIFVGLLTIGYAQTKKALYDLKLTTEKYETVKAKLQPIDVNYLLNQTFPGKPFQDRTKKRVYSLLKQNLKN